MFKWIKDQWWLYTHRHVWQHVHIYPGGTRVWECKYCTATTKTKFGDPV